MIKIFALILSLSSYANAGKWTRVDSETISFSGRIESNEFDKFSAVAGQGFKVLHVDSGGGETSAAMKIGFELRKLAIEIRVNRWCLSSCANYLFTGAVKRVIEKGIVGFHGNVLACFGGDKWLALQKQLEEQGMSPEAIEKFRLQTQEQIRVESEFLNLVGVSQALFDRSCEEDKGMGDGKQYAFLLPLPETFVKYGLSGIVGQQDHEIAKEFPSPLAIQ